MSELVDFGYKKVASEAKAELVQGVFSSVAAKYDVMNDVMSFGLHRLWKDALINLVRPTPQMQLLDVAGGTGDISFRFLKRGGGSAVICDLTPDMMVEGRKRADEYGIFEKINFVAGNAEELPFADNSFDCITIAFGLRNVTNIPKALGEMVRVLKHGGRFFCLEFSQICLPFLSQIYDAYSFRVLPKMGKIIANDADSYQYLAESIRKFPPQDELLTMLNHAKLSMTKYQNLSGGIVAIHQGVKL